MRKEASLVQMSEYKENKEFRILSAIGIILVVAGHLGYNLFDIGGLFPYYSFHVFIFLFVSGYFYKKEAKENMLSYLISKCVTLLLPYYIWNLVYGILAAMLHGAGFTIGQELSLYTLFVAPFDGGHQFMYHFPSWFVPALFLVEVLNICGRKVLSFVNLENEWLILIGCLVAGMLTVCLAQGGHVWGLYRIPGRVLFMLPGFQLGRIYREKLEHRDTLPDGYYFMIVMGIQLLISTLCGGRLAFSTVWVSSFANGPVVPYLTILTGIAFWLRAARIINKISHLSEKLVYIGRNTYAIMMHHVMAFFVVNCVFYILHMLTPLCVEFDTELFFSDISFVFLPGGVEAGKWLYLMAGIAMPLMIAGLQHAVGRVLRFTRDK